MTTTICIAGATGWTGGALVRAVLASTDLKLVGAVARKAQGRDIGEALGLAPAGVIVRDSVAAALDAAGADVLVEYSSSKIAKANALAALARGTAVVVGTSGLTAADYDEIGAAAGRAGKGVIASGNFSVTASLLQRFAEIAARHVESFEVIDYASAAKLDTPSGTARQLAERLGAVRAPKLGRPIAELNGPKETRGADIAGVRVHAIRLPGHVLGVEAVFGMASERLSIRHDAGESAAPYVSGTLIAARTAPRVKGLVRGFDKILFGEVG